jgi:hypothetical protein
MSGISGGDGGEGVTPFYSGGEERRGEERRRWPALVDFLKALAIMGRRSDGVR